MIKRFLFAAGTCMIISSCVTINQDYDLDKIDNGMSLMPGVIIPLDPEEVKEELTMEDLFGFNTGNVKDGVYSLTGKEVESVWKLNEEELSGKDGALIKDSQGKAVITTYELPEIPESLKDLKLSTFKNANITIDLQSSLKDFKLKFNLIADGNTYPLEYDINSGTDSVIIPLSDIIDKYPSDSKVAVTDIFLSAEAKKGTASTITINTSGRVNLPIQFKKGAVVEFNYEIKDLKEEFGLDLSEIEGEFDVKSCVFNGIITHDFPFSVEAEAYNEEQKAKVTLEKIEAFADNQKFKITLETGNGISAINSIMFHLKAVVEEDLPINLNNRIIIAVESVKLDRGIDINL